MENELVKIKEDALKIQEADITDTIRSIENENTKSSFVLGFAAAVFGMTFGELSELPALVAGAFFLVLLSSVGCAFANITAKKLKIHTTVDEIFVHRRPTLWEEYLNNKHLRLRDVYQEAKGLLYTKATLTRWSFALLILSAIFIAITKIIL